MMRIKFFFAAFVLLFGFCSGCGPVPREDEENTPQEETTETPVSPPPEEPLGLCPCEGENTKNPMLHQTSAMMLPNPDPFGFARKKEPSTYEGQQITEVDLDLEALEFQQMYAVVVSGSFPNPCGHAILNIGGKGGWYFHVASDVYHVPLVMSEQGYQRYLKEARKSEIVRYGVILSNPQAARARLKELLTKKWLWLVLPHNCVSFVEEIAKAGGSQAGMYANCPKAERFI